MVYHIVKDNNFIKFNEKTSKKIVEHLLDFIDSFEEKNRYNALSCFALDTIKELIVTSKTHIVVNSIFSNKYQHLFNTFRRDDHINFINSLAATDPKTSLRQNANIKIKMLDFRLNYLISFINILNVCTEKKNAYTENLCSKMVSPQNLEKIFRVRNLDLLLKTRFITFIKNSYLRSLVTVQTNQIYIINHILKLICADFEEGITLLTDSGYEDKYLLRETVIIATNICEPHSTLMEKYMTTIIDLFQEISKKKMREVASNQNFIEQFKNLYTRIFESLNHKLANLPNSIKAACHKFLITLKGPSDLDFLDEFRSSELFEHLFKNSSDSYTERLAKMSMSREMPDREITKEIEVVIINNIDNDKLSKFSEKGEVEDP